MLKDKSLIYTGVIAGVIVLTMAYLTFFVDDPSTLFGKKAEPEIKTETQADLLEKSASMDDDQIRQSLVKFVDAFYRDLRKGYFDPPSYFAAITQTYYNYHNLTYQRLKEAHLMRTKEMQNLDISWVVSSLDFTRQGEQLAVIYWTHVSYFKPSKNAQESGDIKNEMIIDEDGKIVSLRELELKNFSSYTIAPSIPDSLITEEAEPTEAQPNPTSAAPSKPESEVKYEGKLYDLGTVETAPEFPGGQRELNKYLNANLKYPQVARQNKVEGRVYVSFVVEKDGDLSGIYIIKGLGSGCDEEAMRVLRSSPAWKPGMVGGKPVRTSYTLPIHFKLVN